LRVFGFAPRQFNRSTFSFSSERLDNFKMITFEAHLPESQLKILRHLLGKVIFDIYSPALDVDHQIISVVSLSLALEGERDFINVKNEWLETENDDDYWRLSFEQSDNPEGLSYETDETIGVLCFDSRASCIRLNKMSPIEKVEVFEANEENDDEVMSYDHAVLFHQQNGEQFCIAVKQSIADMLEFSRNEKDIQLLLQGCKLRWSAS